MHLLHNLRILVVQAVATLQRLRGVGEEDSTKCLLSNVKLLLSNVEMVEVEDVKMAKEGKEPNKTFGTKFWTRMDTMVNVS